MKVLFTGSAGFIGGYAVNALLAAGHQVVGVDNYSKYGYVAKNHDSNPNYTLINGDCKDAQLLTKAAADCDQIVAGAAMIGGIAYFHKYAYDLLAENDRILASTFDAAIAAFRRGTLKKINVLSSSMVYESTSVFPTPEGAQFTSPPPLSTYGFQKLSAEYFAYGAFQQYGLPYTIIRPFNCVGIGEGRSLREAPMATGNFQLALSHVLPDLALKALRGQKPLHILGDGAQTRCYTHGEDLGRGIRLCVERPEATNEDFNLSSKQPTSVLELARLVWREVYGDEPFAYRCDPPLQHDVQKRIPLTDKAARVLGFRAEIPLEQSVREVVQWVRGELAANRL
jgi:UDP-glucose 4-epimerase